MKKLYLLFALLTAPVLLQAQQNFYKFSIGAGGGITHSHGDLSASLNRKFASGSADFYLTPFLHGGVELQAGNLSGIDNSNNRYFSNDYKAGMLAAKIHLGQFVEKTAARGKAAAITKSMMGIYAGTGAGIIKSTQTAIYRQDDNLLTRGADNNKEIFVPFMVGIDNSGFNSRFVAGIGYQYNYVLGDLVDGYSRTGSRNDIYSNVMLTLKYRFGRLGVY